VNTARSLKERVLLKAVGILITLAILFSYLPPISMDGCSEENHPEKQEMGCGYIFHCPAVYHSVMPQLSALSIHGWLSWVPTSGKIEELPDFIFHPPKRLFKI
jgi:hypothetical protein